MRSIAERIRGIKECSANQDQQNDCTEDVFAIAGLVGTTGFLQLTDNNSFVRIIQLPKVIQKVDLDDSALVVSVVVSVVSTDP